MKRRLLINFFLILIGMTVEINYLSADESAFKTKCSKCHALRNPADYSANEWKYNVERMAKRAGLTPQETQYIISLRTK